MTNFSPKTVADMAAELKKSQRQPANTITGKPARFADFYDIRLAVIVSANGDGSYHATEVLSSSGLLTASPSGRAWDASDTLWPYQIGRPLLVGELVYVWLYGQTWFCAGQPPVAVHFGGILLDGYVHVEAGRVVTPDDETPMEIYGADFAIPLSYDTYVWLEAVLDKSTGAWTVSSSLQSATTAPDDFSEDDSEIAINRMVGAIVGGIWTQYTVGDWYIPHSVFQATGFDLAEVQIPVHGGAGTLYWMNTTDSCGI